MRPSKRGINENNTETKNIISKTNLNEFPAINDHN